MIKDLKHKKITLITSHQGKADQVSKMLSYPVSHKSLELHEIQSLDPKEVIEHKVSEAFKLLKAPVLVEDTSIVIEEFGALPGPFIKYFHLVSFNPRTWAEADFCRVLNLLRPFSCRRRFCRFPPVLSLGSEF